MELPPNEMAGEWLQPDSVNGLHSVTRTWNWLFANPERVRSLPFIGRSCDRLVRLVQEAQDPNSDLSKRLEALSERLECFDSATDAEKLEELNAIQQAFSGLISPGLMGFRVAPVEVRGKLVVPRRGRRDRNAADAVKSPVEQEARNQKSGEGIEPTAPESSNDVQTAVLAGEGPVDSPAAETDSSPGVEAVVPEAVDPEVQAEAEFQRLMREATRGGRETRHSNVRHPPRLTFNHEDGTGRSVRSVAAVPPTMAEQLESLGIQTLSDLLMLAPKKHVQPNRFIAEEHQANERVVVRGVVVRICTRISPAGRRDEAVLQLQTGELMRCRWLLSRPRGFTTWTRGGEIALVGEPIASEGDGWLLLEAEPAGLDGRGSGALPEYELEGIDEVELRAVMAEVVLHVQGRLRDWMPRSMQQRERLLSFDSALRDVHFPGNASGRGRERLAFDELYLLQLAVAWKASKGTVRKGVSNGLHHLRLGALGSQYGMWLTDAQELALDQIRREISRPQSMQRLLQGDVGAGKGRVAFFSAVLTCGADSQVAYIYSDAAAAERAYAHDEPLLRALGISAGLVVGAPNHGQTDALRRGEFHMVYGSVDMLAESVKWRKLGLVVVTETVGAQTVMPTDLDGFERRPDLLVVTRSPLTVEQVLVHYSAFDLTMLSADRHRRVRTTVVGSKERKEAYRRASEVVAEGGQVYVAFPVRDGKDLLSVDDAKRLVDALRAEDLPGAAIGIYSSSMSREERRRVFDDFLHRRVDVLVCTTCIEDVLEVSHAELMLVEYADLHTANRLHRLRGHVARANNGGECLFVLSDAPEPSASERIERVRSEQDGFRLSEMAAEVDPPDLAEQDSGLSALRWSEPSGSRGMMIRTREHVFRVLKSDPNLHAHSETAAMINVRWGDLLGESLPVEKNSNRGGSRGRRRNRRRRRR